MWLSRFTSLVWGLFAVVSGLVFARSGSGVLELINQVGSAFYGPVLAVFTLAIVAPGLRNNGALVGLVSGLVANLVLARLAPGVSWLWWNPAGFFVTCVVALVVGRRLPVLTLAAWPSVEVRVLVGAFIAMIAILIGASALAG